MRVGEECQFNRFLIRTLDHELVYGILPRGFLCSCEYDAVKDCRLLFVVHVLCMSKPMSQSPQLCHCPSRDPDNICPPPDASFATFPHPALLCSKTSKDTAVKPKADDNERQHPPASDPNNRSLGPENLPWPLRYADGLLLPHLHASERVLLRHLPEQAPEPGVEERPPVTARHADVEGEGA